MDAQAVATAPFVGRERELEVLEAMLAAARPAAAVSRCGGHEPSGVQSATGCITSLHKLVKVAVGDNPAILVGCGTETEDAFAGGWRWDVPAPGESVMLAGPSFRSDGTIGAWRFDVQNTSGADKMFTGYVTCLKK